VTQAIATSHVYPINDVRGHKTEWPTGAECWCEPRVEQVCPVCGADEADKVSCSYCSGSGWVAAYGDPASIPTVVIHRAADGRE
jgi:hypothetical protein